MSAPPLPADLRAVISHLTGCYPNEGCGVIVEGADGFTVRPMKNAYDRFHQKDPLRYPRTSRTAYLFDPREQLALADELERSGAKLSCIFHSHCDVGAYFSEEDRQMAAPDGLLLHPGVSYLVVAIDRGRPTAAKVFWWNEGEFSEAPVLLPGSFSL